MSIKNKVPKNKPVLSLQFARQKTLDPRITFTRATVGTYWNDAGEQKIATSGEPRFSHDPLTGDSLGLLIEEARTNYVAYSSNFDVSSTWVKTGVGVNANVEAVLDGTTAGDLVTVTESGGSKSIYRNTSPSAGALTFSVFVKAGASSTVDLGLFQGSWLSLYTFDLVAETATLSQGTGTGKITKVSSSWYRCEVTAVVAAAAATCNIFPGSINNSVGNSVYLWQAQLEYGYMATSFIPTTLSFTSRATVGTYVDSGGLVQEAAINVARNSYNPNNLSLQPVLLLEESRTNLLVNSNVETDLTAWNANSSTLSRDATQYICGTYTVKCIAAGAASAGFFLRNGANAYAISANTMYTFSIFLKGDIDSANKSVRVGIEWRDSGGALVGDVSTSVTLKHGLIRAEVSGISPANATGAIPTCYVENSAVVTWWADMPQLEAGYGATSAIKTTTAAVTRSADVGSSAAVTRNADYLEMTGANFSSWFNRLEGMFVVAFSTYAPDTSGASASKMAYNVGDWLSDYYVGVNPTGTGIDATLVYGGVNQVYVLFTATPSIVNKHAFAYKTNFAAVCLNAGTPTTDTAVALPAPTYLQIGNIVSQQYLNGHIEKLEYYNKRPLIDSELQAVTAAPVIPQVLSTWEKGFFGGGATTYSVDIAPHYAMVDALAFPTEIMNLTSAALAVARGGHAGVNSSQNGYWGGGAAVVTVDEIDGVMFGSETSRNPMAKLSQSRNSTVGINSEQSGYFVGGNMLGNGYSDIDGIRFVDESAMNTAATVAIAQSDGAGVGTSSKGYILGGYPQYVYYSVHSRISGFAYSTQTVFMPSATLISPQATGGGFNSSINGYHYGGCTGNNPGSTQTNMIQAFSLFTEISRTVSETLDVAVAYAGSVNSSTKGYYAGGDWDASNALSTVQDFVFATETASTISATLSQARVSATGVQGSAL